MSFLRVAETGALDTSSVAVHSVAAAATGTSILGALGYIAPIIATIAGVTASTMYLITIWESRTVRHWWRNRVMKRAAKRLIKLRAQQKVVVAKLEAVEKIRAAHAEAREVVAQAKSEAE